MSKSLVLSAIMMAALAAPAFAVSYEVGGCNPNFQNFPTIQAAVNSVPAGSTILICPGIYPEQVTIAQPVTLRGYLFGNAGRAVVSLPPGPLSPNVTNDPWSWDTFAQILITANTPGPVNITGLTVDGKGATDLNGLPLCTTGIFYSSGTSGTVNEVTTRNQFGNIPNQPIEESGCGYGVFAENEPGPTQSVTIENSSVHDFGWAGITTYNRDDSATLNSTIFANFVLGAATLAAIASDANSSISDNFVTSSGSGDGINVRPPGGGAPAGTFDISNNTVTDVTVQAAIDSQGNSTIQSNRISNALFGVVAFSNDVISSNRIMNTRNAITLGCATGPSVSQNILNDAGLGLLDALVPIAGNQYTNLDIITAAPNCN